MRGTGSVENLYPPSYGSRGSSSLSLGSSGGYQKPFAASAPKVNNRENASMYSSLPIIFSPKHELTKHHSDNHLALSCNRQKCGRSKCDGKQFTNEPKFSYGSHFYTPSRKRRFTERKVKGNKITDKRKQTLHLFRSSSDGKKKPFLVHDSDMFLNAHDENSPPPKLPKAVDASSESSCPESLLQSNGNACSTNSSANSTFVDLESDTIIQKPPLNDTSDEEFIFPSPPPLPSTDNSKEYSSPIEKHTETVITTSEVASSLSNSSERSSAQDAVRVSPSKTDRIKVGNAATADESAEQSLRSEVSKCDSKDPEQELNVQTNHSKNTSLKKLSDVFGPEFISMSGLQTEKKVTSYTSRLLIISLFC